MVPLESAFAPELPEITPGDLMVIPEFVSDQGARLRLYPRPAAMDRALDAAANGRWKSSHYMIGKCVYCRLSIWDTALQMWVERDAPDCGEYHSMSAKGDRADDFGSLYGAMLHFGFWRPLAAMPAMPFRADQVHIAPMLNAGGNVVGYKLSGKLTVTGVTIADGVVVSVTLRDANGGELAWAR